MKKIFLLNHVTGILLFLFVTGALSAQNTFFKKIHGDGDDFGHFVIETSDGGYAIVGTTNSFGAGNYDVWLLKTNSKGDTLMAKTFGTSYDDKGYGIVETSDHGFIIVGYKTVPDHYTDGWIFKTDALGNMVWEHTFGTALNGEWASSIVQADAHTFVVSGNMDAKSYVVKIDDQGNIIWEYTYFPNQNSSTTSLCKVNDTLFGVVGSFQIYSAGYYYPNLFTIDANGSVWYQLTYMLESGGTFRFIIGTQGEGMLFGGSQDGQNVVYKILLNGTEEWNDTFNQEAWYQGATSAVQTSDGHFVVTDDTYLASLRKLNATTGAEIWNRSMDLNNEAPKYTHAASTTDNGLILTGYTSDHGLIIVKILENGSMTGVESPQQSGQATNLIRNVPNPFGGKTQLQVRLSRSGFVKLFITDVLGRRVATVAHHWLNAGTFRFVWDGCNDYGNSCPAGIYYAVLITDKGERETLKMVKR